MSEQFVDPIEALLAKHSKATGQEVPSIPTPVSPEPDTGIETTINTPDIDYGENDIVEEIKTAEEKEAEERAKIMSKRLEEAETNRSVNLPPPSTNVDYQAEAVNYQADKFTVLDNMVLEVIRKNNLKPGGIPTEDNHRFRIMGELLDIYHITGETITPEFEALIVDNWVEGYGVDYVPEETATETDTAAAPQKTTTAPTININVEKNTPVTINIDESVMAKTETADVLNIMVKEVTEKELLKAAVINNSNQEGIITPYRMSSEYDVPVTIPLSAYRCVFSPMNWFDTIRMDGPSSGNITDMERKKWSVIYDHITNTSINPFVDFEDFLKKTKYQDKEFLLWALLVATSDPTETLELTCPNPKCKHKIKVTYDPRSIVKLNPDRVPKYYTKTHEVAVGDEAVAHFNEVFNTRTLYKLPDTGIIIEIDEPSAYDYINTKLPLLEELFHRYKPGCPLSEMDVHDESLFEFDYLVSHMMYISAVRIVKDGKEFRYTNWDDIEIVITKSLSMSDSGVLLQIIEKSKTQTSPVSFALDRIECSNCHYTEENVAVNDIGSALLFPLSRRQESTTINLIEMQ